MTQRPRKSICVAGRAGPWNSLSVRGEISAPSLACLSSTGVVPVLFAAALTLGCGLGLLSLVTTKRAASLPGEKGKVASLFMAAAGIGGATGPGFGGAVAGWFGARAVFVGFVPLFVLLAASVLAGVRSRAQMVEER